jgi:hypothetical protein
VTDHELKLTSGHYELVLSRSVDGSRVSFRLNAVDADSGARAPILWLGPVPIESCEVTREPYLAGYVWLFVELGAGFPPVRFAVSAPHGDHHELRHFLAR